MTPLEKFYTDDPRWYEKIGDTHALLERVKISEEQSGDVLHLRKLSRILSIHASTAIEGNRLTLGQVADVINGKPVWGPPKDIKEVQNAWRAYNEMAHYDTVNDTVNELSRRILVMLRDNPRATASVMASALQVSESTVKRHLKKLREQGRLTRVGSDKAGYWVVIEGPP